MATSSQMIPANSSTTPPTSTTWRGWTTWTDTASRRRTFPPWRTKTNSLPRNYCLTRTCSVWRPSKGAPLIDPPLLFCLQGRCEEAAGCLHQEQGASGLWGRFCGILCRVGVGTKPDHHEENRCGHWDWQDVPDWSADVPLPSCCLCQVGPLRVFTFL